MVLFSASLGRPVRDRPRLTGIEERTERREVPKKTACRPRDDAPVWTRSPWSCSRGESRVQVGWIVGGASRRWTTPSPKREAHPSRPRCNRPGSLWALCFSCRLGANSSAGGATTTDAFRRESSRLGLAVAAVPVLRTGSRGESLADGFPSGKQASSASSRGEVATLNNGGARGRRQAQATGEVE